MSNENTSKSGPYPWDDKMAQDIRVLLAQLTGTIIDFEAVDISSGDHTVTMQNNRFMTCTAGTTIKVNLMRNVAGVPTEYTSGLTVPAGPQFIPISNITQVYGTASGTDASNIILWK